MRFIISEKIYHTETTVRLISWQIRCRVTTANILSICLQCGSEEPDKQYGGILVTYYRD